MVHNCPMCIKKANGAEGSKSHDEGISVIVMSASVGLNEGGFKICAKLGEKLYYFIFSWKWFKGWGESEEMKWLKNVCMNKLPNSNFKRDSDWNRLKSEDTHTFCDNGFLFGSLRRTKSVFCIICLSLKLKGLHRILL